MKGCELYGRYRFADESKNTRYWEKKERAEAPRPAAQPAPSTEDRQTD
ncbi:hypothetical protein [Dechloromonas sp. HYN0024]|nr:hypothetical protein [Dechloromonas sp. HYN0024]